jgi:Tol biopolymer transport system component
VLLAVGTYFGAWRGGGGSPGHLAVVDSCGVLTMRSDGTDWRFTCLNQIWAAVSVSGNGKTIAWDTGGGINIADANASNQRQALLPGGANFEPSLSPDGRKVAVLHSNRDDGHYDVWTVTDSRDDAQQLTATRNISSVAWSPADDWIAYVDGWSEQTLEGDIGLIHPDGNGNRKLTRGDAPAWAPDGSRLAFVRSNAVWTIDTDGTGERLLVKDAHSPAWSRDGRILAFMRADNCGKAVCTEHVFFMDPAGGAATQVGPQFPETRRLLWVTSRSVGKPPPK